MKRIGRYEIRQEVGRGAMGVVWEAHDPRVRRAVALKTFHRPEGLSPAQEREFRERFLREAQSAGGLDHPAIVTIYDAGEDDETGMPFIAMELVPGVSLEKRLEGSEPMSVTVACGMVGELADALHTAHAAGVVHRDVKPANVLVRETDGAVKIADFGIARLSRSELTRSGESLGSPAFMSPEQIRGQQADGRSDLFSLAVILYRMLTGRRPFNGDDLSALAYSVVHETPVPVTRLRPDLPAGLDAFFDVALAKERNDRYPCGRTFKQALADAVATPARSAAAEVDVDATTVVPASSVPVATPSTAASPAVPRPTAPAVRRARALRAAVIVSALLLATWLVSLTGKSATLVLDVKSGIEEGELVVRVDGDQVYSRSLAADRKKVRAFGKKLMEWGQEEFETEIDVRPGERNLEVEVMREGDERVQSHKVALDLESGESRVLKITAGRKGGDALTVRVQ